jgi:PAS domain-containing protein
MDEGVYIVNRDCEIMYTNPALEAVFGPPGTMKCHEYFFQRDKPCPWCRIEEVFAGKTVTWEWVSSKTGRRYLVRDQPLVQADGTVLKIEFFRDITELTELRGKVQ